MKSSIAATSRWTKGRFSNFFSSPADNSDVGASSTDQSSAQGEELHHRKHCEEENDGKRSKKSHVSTSTMQIQNRRDEYEYDDEDEDEDNGRIVIKPVNDEDDTSVIITFNQSISPFIIT